MPVAETARYVAVLTVPVDAFRDALAAVDPAATVRDLGFGRTAVTLASPALRDAVAALPGVAAVLDDRLEHLPERPGGRPGGRDGRA